MTGYFFPFAESIYCARLSSSSQEGPVVQNSIMDANAQTLQFRLGSHSQWQVKSARRLE